MNAETDSLPTDTDDTDGHAVGSRHLQPAGETVIRAGRAAPVVLATLLLLGTSSCSNNSDASATSVATEASDMSGNPSQSSPSSSDKPPSTESSAPETAPPDRPESFGELNLLVEGVSSIMDITICDSSSEGLHVLAENDDGDVDIVVPAAFLAPGAIEVGPDLPLDTGWVIVFAEHRGSLL